MVPIQAILTLILKQAGRLLNTMFSWATSLLFGKVPEKRQLYLSVIGLGAVLWIVVVLGIAFPRLAAFLLAFIPLPAWITGWVRVIMLALAVLLPPAVGFVSLFLVEPSKRPEGKEKFRAILKGYSYTLGLALTLVMMLVVAPILKVRDLLRGWTSTHVPVMVRGPDYFEVIKAIEKVLRDGGYEATRDRASALLRWPTRAFTFFAGGSIDDFVAEELTVLKLPHAEVLLHPSDLVIRGKEDAVMRIHALLTEQLTFSRAYFTWSSEAHAVEDRLTALWREVKDRSRKFSREQALDRLAEVDHELRHLVISFEEWEVLFREKLVVERAVLRTAAGLAETPEEAAQPARTS